MLTDDGYDSDGLFSATYYKDVETNSGTYNITIGFSYAQNEQGGEDAYIIAYTPTITLLEE